MDVIRRLELFATDREQEVHREALMTYGEKVTLRKRWTIDHFRAGQVARCSTCQAGGTAGLRTRVSEAYKQAGESYCASCHGVGFEGGYQPTLYLAWAVFTDELEDWTQARTGRFRASKPSVQFLWDPPVWEGDIVVRFDVWNGAAPGTEIDRYLLREVRPVMLRTGPRKVIPADPVTGGSHGVTAALTVGQQADVENLPQEHPLRQVVMTP